jgi:hypothetical protein
VNSLDDEIGGREQVTSVIGLDDGGVVPDPHLTGRRHGDPRPTLCAGGRFEQGPEPIDDHELVRTIVWPAPVLVMGLITTLCTHLWIGPSHAACLA